MVADMKIIHFCKRLFKNLSFYVGLSTKVPQQVYFHGMFFFYWFYSILFWDYVIVTVNAFRFSEKRCDTAIPFEKK